VHPFEMIPGRSLGAPAAWKRSTVDAASHDANDVRFHAEFSNLGIYARRAFAFEMVSLSSLNSHELRAVPANAPGGGYSKPALASVMTITFFLDAVWHVHCPSI